MIRETNIKKLFELSTPKSLKINTARIKPNITITDFQIIYLISEKNTTTKA